MPDPFLATHSPRPRGAFSCPPVIATICELATGGDALPNGMRYY